MNKLDNIKLPENIREITKDSIQKGRSIKNQKSKKLKNTLVASITFVLIVGSMIISSDTALAYIKNITKQIESFLGIDNNSLGKYKYSENKTIETNGVKLTLGDVMLDDKKLLVSMHMDYKNFNFKSNTTDKDRLIPNINTITINDVTFAGQGYSWNEELCKLEKYILFEVDLFEIDTDGDGIGDTSYNLLDKIKPNKDYNLNINFGALDYNDYDNYSEDKYIPIDLNFNTKINASNIIKGTTIKNINKQFDISEKGYEGIIDIQEVRISPISVKLKYTFKSDSSNPESYAPYLIATDDNNREIIGGASGSGDNSITNYNDEFKLIGNEKKLIIRPCVYDQKSDKFIHIGDYSFEVEIPN